MSRRKQSHPKPLKVEMEEPEDSSPVINVTQISPASASSSSMSSITKMTPESPLSLNHSLVSSESTKTTSVTSASPITANSTSTIETSSSKTSSNIILPLVNAPSSSSSSVSVILETASQVKCTTNSSDANLVTNCHPSKLICNNIPDMTTTSITLDSCNSSIEANAKHSKSPLNHQTPVKSTAASPSSSTSVTTASLILPSASSLLSQPIFVAIKTSPLILVPCSFDSSTGCLSIAPSFNPQLLSSNAGTSSHVKVEPICTDEPPAVALSKAGAIGSIGSSGRIENTSGDGSRSSSPESESVGRPQAPTPASSLSGYSSCNLLPQIGKSGDSKKNDSAPLKVASSVNSVNCVNSVNSANSSHTECGVKSAAAVLAAFASSNSHTADDVPSKGTSGHHQSIGSDAPSKVDSVSPSTSSGASSSSLPLDLSSRSIAHPPPVSNFNSIASLASSVNSYVNSLLPGHGLHNATALIHAMLHNANNPSPSSLANGHNNLSMMAALQAALAADCSDLNCNCCKGGTDPSGPHLNGSSASGNPVAVKRRRASNAIVIAPGSSSFLSKPLHSDIESNTPSPTHCVSSPPAPSSMGHISSGPTASSGTPSLLMPSHSQLNQLVAAAVAQQPINPAAVGGGSSSSNSMGAITPVVVTGTTAGSGGVETATVKQGTHRCEDCNIVFYRQENYLVHKANYCASRRGSSDRDRASGGGGCSSSSSSHKEKSSINGSTSTPNILASLSKSGSMAGLNSSPCDGGSNNSNRVNDRSSSQMSSGQESMDRTPSSSPEVSQDTIVTTNGTSTTAPRSVNSSPPPLSPIPALVPPGSSVAAAAAASLAATAITVNGPLVQYFCVACGIRFTSLDTLHAHQTFYCLKRSSIAAAAVAAAAGISAAPLAATTSPKGSSVDSKHESADAISDTLSHSSTHPSPSSSNSTSLKSTTSSSGSCDRPASSSSNNQQSFKCTICGYKGHTIRGMRTHVRMHSDQLHPGVSEETFIQSMDPTIDINLLTSSSASHSGSKMSGRRRTAAASNLATASPSATGKRKKGLPCLRC